MLGQNKELEDDGVCNDELLNDILQLDTPKSRASQMSCKVTHDFTNHMMTKLAHVSLHWLAQALITRKNKVHLIVAYHSILNP
jgi:hypothetical protein